MERKSYLAILSIIIIIIIVLLMPRYKKTNRVKPLNTPVSVETLKPTEREDFYDENEITIPVATAGGFILPKDLQEN